MPGYCSRSALRYAHAYRARSSAAWGVVQYAGVLVDLAVERGSRCELKQGYLIFKYPG